MRSLRYTEDKKEFMAKDKNTINRRSFLKLMSGGIATTSAIAITGCTSRTNSGRGGAADRKSVG